MTRKESKETRSQIMSSIRSKGTAIEREMRKILNDTGLEFKEHPTGIFGNPDFVILERKIAIFCDGDFWHGYKMKSNPRLNVKENRVFWLRKIRGNVRRDLRVNLRLEKEGWKIIRFWEHEIKREPELVREKLRRELRA